MAAEQDWPTYADQAYIANNDTLLARTGAGGGVEIPGLHFVARRAVGGPNVAQASNPIPALPVAGAVTGTSSLWLTNGFTQSYGLNIGVLGTGESWLQGQRQDGTGTLYNMLLNPLGGNVGIGTTAPGLRLQVKSNSEIARFETTTARGGGVGFVGIADPTGRKGYWGYGGADDVMWLANELNANIRIFTPGPSIEFHTGSTLRAAMTSSDLRPQPDNAMSLGNASARWTIAYCTTGTINTSDERQKKWRGAASKAEFKAATRIFKELGFYQWLDVIEEKNAKKARYHFGVRAQRVWAIMAEEGLVDPITGEGKDQKPGKTPYAFLCYDEWDEETKPETEGWRPGKILDRDGNPIMVKCRGDEEASEQRPTGNMIVTREAGNGFGVRPDQLALFLLAAIGDKLEL